MGYGEREQFQSKYLCGMKNTCSSMFSVLAALMERIKGVTLTFQRHIQYRRVGSTFTSKTNTGKLPTRLS